MLTIKNRASKYFKSFNFYFGMAHSLLDTIFPVGQGQGATRSYVGNRGKDSFQKAPSYGPAGVLSLTSGESHCEVVEGLTGFMSQSTLRTCVPLQRVRKLQENHVLTYF